MFIIDFFKTVILGIVEGITEWLPISSTGHMILVNEFLNSDKGFFGSQIYLYVIQLGAILAIATIYFKKLNPFYSGDGMEKKNSLFEISFGKKNHTVGIKKNTFFMWIKVIVACLPAAVIGLLFNDAMDRISTPLVVSIMLIVYGVGFLAAETGNKKAKLQSIDDMTYKTAILIGMFQVLSIVPGTSRSGATILGAILIGCSRSLAAEFSFFLAIPVMFGVSFLKIITNDYVMYANEWVLLLAGMLVAYFVSLAAVKFLTDYVKKHDFKVFGYYRILVGIIILLYFAIKG